MYLQTIEKDLVRRTLFCCFQGLFLYLFMPASVTPRGICDGDVRLIVAKPKTKAPEDKALVRPYEPKPYEKEIIARLRKRNAEKPLVPRMKVAHEDGTANLAPNHPDPAVAHVRFLDALGTHDYEFLDGLLRQLCGASIVGGKVDENRLNFMLSLVQGIEPRDQVEAMLAAQMAATHNAVMTFANRLNRVETIPQQDSAERAFNKLARTFASQLEALKRYRSAGEQTVRVEHVTVNDGGQAIVGNVSHGGSGSKTGQSS
jgi:hypothetical protein